MLPSSLNIGDHDGKSENVPGRVATRDWLIAGLRGCRSCHFQPAFIDRLFNPRTVQL